MVSLSWYVWCFRMRKGSTSLASVTRTAGGWRAVMRKQPGFMLQQQMRDMMEPYTTWRPFMSMDLEVGIFFFFFLPFDFDVHHLCFVNFALLVEFDVNSGL